MLWPLMAQAPRCRMKGAPDSESMLEVYRVGMPGGEGPRYFFECQAFEFQALGIKFPLLYLKREA